jgi:DNA polymerase III sliding clamp (beta) subunit (PCNA family)
MNPTIELPAADLKGVLAGIGKVVHGRNTLPVLGCVKFAVDATGCLNISGTDLDTTVTAQLGIAPVCEPLLVPLEPLSRLVKSLPATERVTIRRADKTRVSLGYQLAGSRVEQPVESPALDEWPPEPVTKQPVVAVDGVFKQTLRQVLECASTDSSRYVLNGVCIDISEPDCHCLVATDGRHLYSANTFRFDLGQSVIIPSRKFLNWSPFHDDGDWFLSFEPDKEGKPAWVRIQSDHWTFLTKAIDGSYPNWRQLVPKPGPKATRAILSQESVNLMLDVLPRLPGMNESCQSVSLVLNGGGMLVRGREPGADWTEVPVPAVTIHGDAKEVSLNRSYLARALRFGFTELVVLDALSPVLFTAPGRTLLVMPVRTDNTPAAPAQNNPPPPEAAESTPPSAAQPVNPTEERNAMANNITTPERGNPKNGSNGETQTALGLVIDHVEQIKTRLKEVVGDLNKTIDLLKSAEKEKKATLKEVESVRATLRSLQKVEL